MIDMEKSDKMGGWAMRNFKLQRHLLLVWQGL